MPENEETPQAPERRKKKVARKTKFPWKFLLLPWLALGVVLAGLFAMTNRSHGPVTVGKAPELPPEERVSLTLAPPKSPMRKPITIGSAEQIELRHRLAESEFRSKNYAEAERIYRELLPDTRRKPLVNFQIFACLVGQGRKTEAVLYVKSHPELAKTPFASYAKTVVLFLDGQPEDARQSWALARAGFPTVAGFYDPIVRALGFEP